MDSYLSTIVATWLCIGAVLFWASVYAIRRLMATSREVAKDRFAHLLLSSRPMQAAILIGYLVLWPGVVLIILSGFFKQLLGAYRRWRTRRKLSKAIGGLGNMIAKISADMPSGQGKDDLMAAMAKLNDLAKGKMEE